jgi:hypothetical protein
MRIVIKEEGSTKGAGTLLKVWKFHLDDPGQMTPGHMATSGKQPAVARLECPI